MSDIYKKGSKVFWKWGRGKIKGIIEEIYLEPIEKKIKNVIIKRKASKDNPAYFIKEANKEAHVLKLHSELITEKENL